MRFDIPLSVSWKRQKSGNTADAFPERYVGTVFIELLRPGMSTKFPSFSGVMNTDFSAIVSIHDFAPICKRFTEKSPSADSFVIFDKNDGEICANPTAF